MVIWLLADEEFKDSHTPEDSVLAHVVLSFLSCTLIPGISIRVANVVKDLGVLMYNTFSPCMHCKETASKARRMRSFAELSVSAFAILCNTLDRPHLGYAMQACSPNFVADADCLERIQRLGTRFGKGFRRLPNEERLRRLGLHSLHKRRLHGGLIVVCKMFSGGLDLGPKFFYSASAVWLERSFF